MKKCTFIKAAAALTMATSLVLAGCSNITNGEDESVSVVESERATISGTSSFYADDLSHGTFTSNVTSGNYTI